MGSLEEFGEAISSVEASIGNLRRKNILRSDPPICELCDRAMTQVGRVEATDGYMCLCPEHKGKKAIRVKSFIEKSHLTLAQFVSLTYFWSNAVMV